MILSQHVEAGTATQLLAEHPERLGYLLKDRVTDIDDFVRTLRHVAGGGSALDPQIVSRLLSGTRDDAPAPASATASATSSAWSPRAAQQGRSRTASESASGRCRST